MRNTSLFWPPFLNRIYIFYFDLLPFLAGTCFQCSLCWWYVYTDMVQVSYLNSWGKVRKNGWVQVDPPLRTDRSEKQLRQKVLNHTILLSLLCNVRQNVFSEIHDLILIPCDLMLTSDTILRILCLYESHGCKLNWNNVGS